MEIKVKDQLVGLTPYQPGKPTEELKRELGLTKIYKLASNENPLGCSKKVDEVIKNSDELMIYPDGYAFELRQRVAEHVDVDMSQLIFGAGSDELIAIISRALLSQGTNTVMAKPTFPQYKHNAVIEKAEIREVENIEGRHNLDGMLQQIDENTKIVWVCSPNNPSGEYVRESELRAFVEKVPSNVLIVLDEAYYEYVYANDYPETIPWLKEFSNIIILRTFSKGYGLAALRLGYGIGHPDFIRAIEPIRPPFNTSRLAQKAGIAALDDQEFIKTCREVNKQGLEQYYAFCEEKGLSYYPSQGNFILIDFKMPGNEVFQYLLHKGYIVRSGEVLGYPTCCRITVGNKEENAGLIQVLSEMIAQKAI